MATSSSDLPHNLMAFVNDPVSEQIINNVIKEMNLAYAEAKQGTIPEIVEFMKTNRTPKVLIADISDSELPLGDITKIKEFSAPNLNIIVIGSRNDVGLFRDLMNMGVSDYIVKPLNNVILRTAVDDAINNKKTTIEKSGKLINVISSIGGAGATTVAANIAWLLANVNFKRTVLMDMDFLFGTANLLLDLKAENAYLDIIESPDKIDDYFIETILKKSSNRLYYLGGLCDLVRGVVVDLEAFDTLVNVIKKQFNYVVVDSQREVSGVTKIGLNKAEMFIIMVEMSLASAQNAGRILEFFNTDQGGKKILIVANKVGMSANGALSKEAFEKVIGRKINYSIPFDEVSALASANIGQPLAASGGSIVEILEEITNDIMGKNESVAIENEIVEKEGITMDVVKNKVLDFISRLK
ncbi:MAG: AAA family ATPase [Alphaproteobacteria bacterium]|nr:AAA family ATPase [Alphaproteobacteria bacterium]